MKKIFSQRPNIINIESYNLCRSSKLPLSVVRGTEEQRYKLAENFAFALQQGLDKVSTNSSCKVFDFVKLIDNILSPFKININIKQLKEKDGFLSKTAGLIKPSYEEKRNFKKVENTYFNYYEENTNGYNIMLKLSEDGSLIKDKYAAFHEARHLFDYICNPKTIINRSSNIINNEDMLSSLKVKLAFLRNTNILGGKYLKKQAEKYLNKMEDSLAIDCLQRIRTNLKTEVNAYKDELDFLCQKPFKNLSKILLIKEYLLFHNHSKRFKIANELLAERLQTIRESNV